MCIHILLKVFFATSYCLSLGKRYGTNHAVTKLVETTAAFEQKEFVVGVFFDLSKAFDTINYDVFLVNYIIMVSEVAP